MVFLQRKRPAPPRPDSPVDPKPRPSSGVGEKPDDVGILISVLADAGCTLAPPSLPSDPHALPLRLQSRFSSDPALVPPFLAGFERYVRDPHCFCRVLSPVSSDYDGGLCQRESIARLLLLVPSIQLQLQIMFLEKLPEHFDRVVDQSDASLSLKDDIARMIVNQFRWLDFLVDPENFSEKLKEVLSICPLSLKKEIIGSLPEIIGDKNNGRVVAALEQMLQEDIEIIVPVLDALSNLNLDDHLQDKAISISLSCIRTVDIDHMPHLLRFLLLSATTKNITLIIAQIREHLQFGSLTGTHAVRSKKFKGKSLACTAASVIIEALRSALQFRNMICHEILKELRRLTQPQDHKVIDIWLLVLIYTNGGTLRKDAEKLIKKKIIEGFLSKSLFDQCLHGHAELVKDYFSTFLSLCEYLLICKENEARNFATHAYMTLFVVFNDTYSRQEVLGALVAHIGSGVYHEVTSALDIVILLTLKQSKELVSVSSHINGILDYLEQFTEDNLHKVYEVFCQLALFSELRTESTGSSFMNELLMIIRKQVGNADMRYKKMGIIGALKIVSKLGDVNLTTKFFVSQKSSINEALELLKMCLESCRPKTLSLIMFYDELIALLEATELSPSIMEWLGKHVGEFESIFLSDLDGGQLPGKSLSICLEGELWMNLDGDISPICLDILQLLISSELKCSSTLQILPVQFQLLSAIERSASDGSLGGVDALLGCPFHLPLAKYLSESLWKSLTGTHKMTICLSLYYAVNWIRELLNAFSTQVAGGVRCVTQSTKREMISKIFKRLRNLVCLESLLNSALKQYPISFPELHNPMEQSGPPLLCFNSQNREKRRVPEICPKGNHDKKISKRKKTDSKPSDTNQKLKQRTILEMLRKESSAASQDLSDEVSKSDRMMPHSIDLQALHSIELGVVDISAVPSFLERQKFKFRPLLVDCLFILSLSQGQGSCCSDSTAELPLHLYMLRDFHYKLDWFNSSARPRLASASKVPLGLRMTTIGFLEKVQHLFPSLRKHLDVAFHVLQEDDKTCQNHWKCQSVSAGNPDFDQLEFSKYTAADFVCREVLWCYKKLLELQELFHHDNMPIFRNLLEAFQPNEPLADFLSELQPLPVAGDMDYLYCGVYLYLQNIMNLAGTFSFSLASEVLTTLEVVVNSVPLLVTKLLDGNGKNTSISFSKVVYPFLQKRLEVSAHSLLVREWDNDDCEWKSKGDILQKILQIYLKNNNSTSSLLVDLACSVLPQVVSCNLKGDVIKDAVHCFPTLCPAMFVNWYKVLHEENLLLLNKLVRDVISSKPQDKFRCEITDNVLAELHQFVNVVVSLVNLCKTDDKVIVHTMTVKYGGKFIDTFLKAFDFLEGQFQSHGDAIIKMVKELQKATRIIQALCSEAKVSKRTMVISKIPAIKRSMERFLFCVKALLHNTSNGHKFWMGSLKHKDLFGNLISSQAYIGGDDVEHTHIPEAANHVDVDCELQSET